MTRLPCYLVAFLASAWLASAAPRVLFLGDSLTAGYGLELDQAYPALIEAKIQAAGWSMQVTNSGVSGETTAGGRRRLAWVLKKPVAVLVVALGGNDGLRGIPVAETKRNLEAIIDEARRRQPGITIVLAGMQMPPNLGAEYTAAFRAVYPAVAKEKDVQLIPFLLEGVGGVPELNQADGIHPTAEGQVRVAENVWAVLEPLLRGLAGDKTE